MLVRSDCFNVDRKAVIWAVVEDPFLAVGVGKSSQFILCHGDTDAVYGVKRTVQVIGKRLILCFLCFLIGIICCMSSGGNFDILLQFFLQKFSIYDVFVENCFTVECNSLFVEILVPQISNGRASLIECRTVFQFIALFQQLPELLDDNSSWLTW